MVAHSIDGILPEIKKFNLLMVIGPTAPAGFIPYFAWKHLTPSCVNGPNPVFDVSAEKQFSFAKMIFK